MFGPPFDVPLLNVATGKAAAHVKMQLAVTGPEQHHGLMFKKSMPDEDGMLFLYTYPQARVLWMKDTFIPLDAAWFTEDGVLQEIHHLKPFDLTYRWSKRDDIVMGLEMSVNYFKRHGIVPGTVRLDEAALADALRARGVDPKPFKFLGAAAGAGHLPPNSTLKDANAALTNSEHTALPQQGSEVEENSVFAKDEASLVEPEDSKTGELSSFLGRY